MTRHSITAEFEILSYDGDYAYPLMEIAFDFTPGAAPIIDYVNGGDPGYAPEIERHSAKLIEADGLIWSQAEIDRRADAYLQSDYGFDEACVEARGDRAEARSMARAR